jgi:hypothetical protein
MIEEETDSDWRIQWQRQKSERLLEFVMEQPALVERKFPYGN